MRHYSDEEDISQPAACGRPLSQNTIPGAGRPLGDVNDYSVLNQTMADDPWNPFSSEADFNLASCFVCNMVAKLQIDTFLANGLGGMDSRSFWFRYDKISTYRTHLVITSCGLMLRLTIVDI